MKTDLFPVVMETNYSYLKEAVNQALRYYGFTPTFLSGLLSDPLDFKPSGFMCYIRNVRKGDIYGMPNEPNDPRKGIERLEILLYGLNLHQDQVLIDGLNKKIEGELTFPPKNGISYDQLMELYREYKAMKNGHKAPEFGLEARV